MAKYSLNTSNEDFDFVLIGLMCANNQYQVIGAINDILKINLQLQAFVPYNLKDGKLFNFSLFNFLDEDLGLEYNVIPNQSNFEGPNINSSSTNDLFSSTIIEESVRLIKELPKTDYFIVLKGEDLHNYQFKIIDKLKTVSDFLQVQPIAVEELPSKRNLMF